MHCRQGNTWACRPRCNTCPEDKGTLEQRQGGTPRLNPHKNPIHPENHWYEVLPYKENEEKRSK